MNFLELRSATTTTEGIMIFLIQHQLIINNPMYLACQRQMHLEKGKSRHGLDKRWQCSIRTCRKTISVFKYSIFDKMHIPINHCLYILYFKAMELTIKKIAFELDHKPDHIAKFINKALSIVD
ncbi:hypothetical protein COBT_003265, partial [Conglomerata obtusa]